MIGGGAQIAHGVIEVLQRGLGHAGERRRAIAEAAQTGMVLGGFARRLGADRFLADQPSGLRGVEPIVELAIERQPFGLFAPAARHVGPALARGCDVAVLDDLSRLGGQGFEVAAQRLDARLRLLALSRARRRPP